MNNPRRDLIDFGSTTITVVPQQITQYGGPAKIYLHNGAKTGNVEIQVGKEDILTGKWFGLHAHETVEFETSDASQWWAVTAAQEEELQFFIECDI